MTKKITAMSAGRREATTGEAVTGDTGRGDGAPENPRGGTVEGESRGESKGTILVVDDEPNVVEIVRLYLSREGFTVLTALDGEAALALARRTPPPDLIVLDLMLPKVDGWEVCRRVRTFSAVPIIMLTARGEDIDRIVGLELGADDYLAKPFNPRELVARVKAVLRRTKGALVAETASPGGSAKAAGHTTLRYPGLTIDREAREVWVRDRRISLTPKEFELLWQLASSPGRTFTREELLESVWGYEFFGSDRTVDVHIKRLREKLEKSEDLPPYLQTVWGVGYKFDPLAGDLRQP